MRLWQRVKSAASNILHRDNIESDLHEEIREYVDALAGEKTEAGMTPSEARRLALAEIGGLEQVKQAVRDSRSGTGIELLWQDVRYGLRMLRRNPSFTWTAVITLGLGIGATTAIFSAVYSLLLRPLPYPEPDQLASITAESPKYQLPALVSPDFVAAQHAVKSLSQVAGYWWANRNLTGSGKPVRIVFAGVTANFLPLLGVHTQLGRDFSGNEDRPGGPPLIILGNHFWQSQFNSDPRVIGRAVAIDGRQETVIGVLPRSFSFPNYGMEPDVYAPADLDRATTLSVDHGVLGVFAIGRLRPGSSTEQAQAELQTFFQTRARSYPPAFAPIFSERQVVVESLRNHLTGDDRGPLWILLAAVAAVLFIACFNVANLQMARAISSRHETAVRSALGASRSRLMRKSLVESLLVSLFAAAVGLAIALLVTALIHHAGLSSKASTITYAGQSFQLPFGKLSTLIQVNGWVVGSAVGLALLATLLSGLAPAVSGGWTNLRNALQAAAFRVTSSREQQFLRHSLLVLQIGLAVVLLAAAGLLVRSFVNVLHDDSGFDANNTLTAKALLTGNRYLLPQARRNFAQNLLPRLGSLPGVKAAALASALPLANVDGGSISFDDNPDPPLGLRQTITTISVTPDYFRAAGTPLFQGRVFDSRDSAASARVAIVNRAFAKQFFPGDTIGRHFNVGQLENGQFRYLPTTIVGIAENVRHNGLAEKLQPEVYVPLDQIPSEEVDIILRINADPSSLSNAMREAVIAVDHEQPLFDVETMNQRLSNLMAQRKLIMFLIASFAALAMILAAVGVFGVFTYSVRQRTQEMGIRLALGSSRSRLLQLILAQAARLILLGGAVGLGSALLLSRLLAGTLVGVTPHDTLSFSLAWGLMTFTGLLASMIPAMGAARTALISVLHEE